MATISFQCYSCQQVLKVGADKAGKRGKCPKCGTSLTVPISSTVEDEPPPAPAAPPPAPAPAPRPVPPPLPAAAVPHALPEAVSAVPLRAELVDEDEPPPPQYAMPAEEVEEAPYRPRAAASTPTAWARLGLLLTFIGFCVIAGAFLFEFISYLLITVKWIQALSGTNPFTMGTPGFVIMWRVAEPLALAGLLTAITGYVFCLLGPKQRGALAMAITTLATAAVYLLLDLIFHLPLVYGTGPALVGGTGFGRWFGLVLTQLTFGALVIVFPLYLRAVCLARNRQRTAGSCLPLVFVAAAYTAFRLFAWIMYYVMGTSRPGSEGAAKGLIWTCIILLWIGSIIFTVYLILLIIKQWAVRSAIK